MLSYFPIFYAKHIEPRGGVITFGIFHILYKGKNNHILFGNDGYQRHLHPVLYGFCGSELTKKVHKALSATWHIRIMLKVRLSQVFIGKLQMPAFKHFPPEVINQSLICSQLWVVAV